MSKAIRSYPIFERTTVVIRRIKGETKGLGYWAAIDYLKKEDMVMSMKKNGSDNDDKKLK